MVIIIKIKTINNGIVRIFSENGRESLLTRYGILNEINGKATDYDSKTYTAVSKRNVTFSISEESDGFGIEISADDDERFFGLGDATRDNISMRGRKIDINICNITTQGPIPFLMSSYGWGILINNTYAHTFDICGSVKGKVIITAPKGRLDFYIFTADSMKKVLELYSQIAGKPIILPAFAYGFTYVENEESDARSILNDTRTFRDRDIPCDILGLEPSWMETHYDFSTSKKWNLQKYRIPCWKPVNDSSTFTFFYPLRAMGMNFSLWLCENYDLLWHEDKKSQSKKECSLVEAEIQDPHFINVCRIDEITKDNEQWFEHLKKFVDNGAVAFKLDGCTQSQEHPDRLWGGKYLDDEIHNVYPVILAKQMKEGFEEYTGRRALVYSPVAYAGVQKYIATWAGDTGGGYKTLVSVMNYAMCGHTNASCDVEVSDPYAIHYGFLITWTQQLGWDNWRCPWFLGDKLENMIRFYSKLRSSLFPYIYSMAHIAAKTALPVARPMSLVYEDTDEFDRITNMYMLGDSLLVGAFDMHMKLPQGDWIDFWTGKHYSGEFDYEIPEDRGGALLVKAGAVFVTMQPQKYILEKNHDYIINVYHGGNGEFTLVEDDGYTYDYINGKVAETRITSEESDGRCTVTVYKRTGSFDGRPDNGHDMLKNSIPEIKGILPVAEMKMRIYGEKPEIICLDDKNVEFVYKNGFAELSVPAKLHAENDLKYVIVR